MQEVTALRKAHSASKTHVPKLHEVVQTDRMLYLALDQVNGIELYELLLDGPLAEPLARRLMRQLMQALAALHEHHIVHRDVKPENLMVVHAEEPHKCKLVMIDFGYAACGTAAEAAGGLTELAGSPEYAETAVHIVSRRGSHSISARFT